MDSARGIAINIEDEMKQSYMDYAMSVIVGRAIPDARDGLKPVQRRVLYAMLGEGLTYGKKHSKCAGVVGEVLKRLHPHGDSSVYEALVRLAQPWSMRYPLVDGQGNFGSIDGDPPAAYRYTECRLTKIAEHLLTDLDKDTVDFIANFDDTNVEPVVLPASIPNLVVNGSDGIAVGMATHVPPHNLNEVLLAAQELIKNPQLTLDQLLEIIPGPDFPTGGTIQGRKTIREAYETGKGIISIRAKTEIETIKSRNREVEAIVVTELPYQVNKARLLERIAELVNERTIDGISHLRDESDRTGMRIVIEVKRDATTEIVLNQLFKHTYLQSSFGIINLAIVEGKPLVCSMIQLLNHFIDHRRDVVTRRTLFELKRAEQRLHLLEGFRIALLNIDEVIALIKGSETPASARTALRERFELSAAQAQAILDLRLQRLTGMERLAIEKEHEELVAEIERLRAILADSCKVDEIIYQELEEIRQEFGDERRTIISDEVGAINIEDLIEDEEMVITLSHHGYIKRAPTTVYRAQKRGGRGISGTTSRGGEDFVEHLFVASSLADLLVFTTFGRMYWLKVYEIPVAGRTARGRALVNLLRLREDEGITAVLPVREFAESRVVFMATRRGIVKRVNLMEFSRARRGGIIACTLEEGDALIGVGLTWQNDEVILGTRSGMTIRFSEQEVRTMGRTARGVRGIKLRGDDVVVGMTVIAGNSGDVLTEEDNRIGADGSLLTVCSNGFGKRTRLGDYRAQSRGGIGLIDIQTGDRNGPAVGVCSVGEDDEVMLITSGGKVIRMKAADISVIGRNTKGVKLVELEEHENVVAVAHLAESDA